MAGFIPIGSGAGSIVSRSTSVTADGSIKMGAILARYCATELTDSRSIVPMRGQPGAAANTTRIASPTTIDRAAAIRRAGCRSRIRQIPPSAMRTVESK